jgi:MFS family permease
MWPSSSAFLPQLVPRSQFPKAVTWNSGSFHLSSVAGPAAGGAIIALTHSATPVYILETVAALVCLALILFVRVERAAPARMPLTLRNLGVGFSFVFSNPVVLGIITLDMFAVLLGGATSLLPVYAKDILHVGPSGLGLLQAALPAGSLTCSLTLAHLPPMRKAGRTLLSAVALFGLATVVFGVSSNFWLSMLMLYICGVSDNVSVIIRHTLVQLLTPDDKRGRVSAVNSLFIGTSNELGGFESGVVANWFGPVASVVAGGIGPILVVIGVGLAWPQIRNYGRLTTPSDT